jgi:hypothetical protein
MMLDRRRFLAVSAAGLSGALLAACNENPRAAGPLLDFAERKNESVERRIFRHDARNMARPHAFTLR